MISLWRCLKLYAPAIVLVILAGLVQITPDSPVWVGFRLVALAAALAISIREQRRGRRER